MNLRCWCGAPQHLQAGNVFGEPEAWVWLACDNGHPTEPVRTPAMVGLGPIEPGFYGAASSYEAWLCEAWSS